MALLGENTMEMLKGNPDDLQIQGCQLVAHDRPTFSSEILYYLADNGIPAPPTYTETTVLFKNRESIPQDYLSADNVNIIIPDESISAEHLYNKIQEVFNENPLIVRGTQMLMDALFSDYGLQYIVDCAFDITGHPIYVVDTSYRYLAISYKGEINSLDSSVLDEESKKGYITDEGVEFIKKVRLDETVRKNPRPFYFFNVTLGGGTLIDLIKIHGIEVARIMMYELDKPFTKLDKVIFSRLAGIISLELRKSSFFRSNRGVMYSYLFAELLEHGVSNYTSVTKRLQVMGFELMENLQIMVVDAASSRLKSEARFEMIASQLHLILTRSMYVFYQDRLVMLISRSDKGISESELSRVNGYLAENSLVAGLSNSFSNIQDVRQYYRQALKAAELGDKVYHSPAIYHYSNLSLLHMLSICEAEGNLINFCNPKLLALLKYDRDRNTELTKTLYQYLLRVQVSRKTATDLHIHKNTLLYRIEKIKEVLGSSLDDGEELMQLHMSFHILSYLKLIRLGKPDEASLEVL